MLKQILAGRCSPWFLLARLGSTTNSSRMSRKCKTSAEASDCQSTSCTPLSLVMICHGATLRDTGLLVLVLVEVGGLFSKYFVRS